MSRSTKRQQRVLTTWAIALVILLTGIVVFTAKIRHDQRTQAVSHWRKIAVELPAGLPPLSQNSIDLALSVYGIEVPSTASHPILNTKLQDRGISTRMAWSHRIKVEIGPSAFSSWSLLGSTLAHELEVHCRQNFFLISAMDTLGLDGTAWAEREAYLHEIRNARRFGLTPYHTELIASTMAYYYSFDQAEVRQGRLAAGLSRTLGRFISSTESN